LLKSWVKQTEGPDLINYNIFMLYTEVQGYFVDRQ